MTQIVTAHEYEAKIRKAMAICNRLPAGKVKRHHISRLFSMLNKARADRKRELRKGQYHCYRVTPNMAEIKINNPVAHLL